MANGLARHQSIYKFLGGVVVGTRDLFVPYFVMSISFIQCAKELFPGKRFGSRSRFGLEQHLIML